MLITVRTTKLPRDVTFALAAGNDILKIFGNRRVGWSAMNLQDKDGRTRVIRGTNPVEGILESYDTYNGVTYLMFKYPAKQGGPLTMLYFWRNPTDPNGRPPGLMNQSINGRPPMTTPEAPLDLELRLGLPVAYSNESNPTELWQTGRTSGSGQ
jgi:hypothetical protein